MYVVYKYIPNYVYALNVQKNKCSYLPRPGSLPIFTRMRVPDILETHILNYLEIIFQYTLTTNGTERKESFGSVTNIPIPIHFHQKLLFIGGNLNFTW